MRLIRGDREVQTVFDLLGENENDMTAALGWVLGRSEHFLQMLVRDITGEKWGNLSNAIVQLQTGRVGYGITDVEIVLGSDLAMIFEAKRGTQLPSDEQLSRYAGALSSRTATNKQLVAVTNATPIFAATALSKVIKGVPVCHRSWREIRIIAEKAAGLENNANKNWLRYFIGYLGRLLQMETRYSNLTYVVSLNSGVQEGWGISWIDIVEKQNRYFYPITGGGWPKSPPNYLAFRYNGKLQRISRVLSHEIATNPHTIFPADAPNAKDYWDPPFYVLTLGKAIRPDREIRVGSGINYAARVWCMIDTLLTSKTITDAMEATKKLAAAP